MTSDAVSNARLKVDRAAQHLGEFKTLLRNDPTLELPIPEAKPEMVLPGKPGFMWQIKTQPIPARASLIVGDIAHNLRSALDLLVYDEMGASGIEERKRQFPIANDAGHLDKLLRDSYGPLRTVVSDYLRCCKPYNGGDGYLRGLHDLDIADKHRILLKAYVAVQLEGLQLAAHSREWQFGNVLAPPPDAEGVVRLWGVVGSDPGRMANHPNRAKIAFDVNSPFGPFPVDEVLRDALLRVIRVIDGFAALPSRP